MRETVATKFDPYPIHAYVAHVWHLTKVVILVLIQDRTSRSTGCRRCPSKRWPRTPVLSGHWIGIVTVLTSSSAWSVGQPTTPTSSRAPRSWLAVNEVLVVYHSNLFCLVHYITVSWYRLFLPRINFMGSFSPLTATQEDGTDRHVA